MTWFAARSDGESVVLETGDTTSNDRQTILKEIVGKDFVVGPMAISADRRRALTGHPHGTLRLWDLTNGKLLRSIEAKLGQPSLGSPSSNPFIAISAEGTLGLSISHGTATNSMLILWDLETGEVVRSWEGLGDEWDSLLAFSPDGKWAVARKRTTWMATDGNWHRKEWAVIWEIATGKAVLFDDLTFLAFSPDSQHLLLRHETHLCLWNLATCKEKWRLPKPEDWHSFAFTPDGTTLLTIGGKRYSFGYPPNTTSAALWDANTGKPIRVLKGGPVGKPADDQADSDRWTWKKLFRWK
jgi:hypothetical protein